VCSLRIVFDGRYIQDHFPGIGRYTYNLIRTLAELSTGDELIVLHDPAAANTRYDVAALGMLPHVRLVRSALPVFSLTEQWRLPLATRRLAPSLFHSPYYLKPYLLLSPSVVNVNDLIPAR
jgi:alpha-1,3-rhamnosyl/mannosyltransferase